MMLFVLFVKIKDTMAVSKVQNISGGCGFPLSKHEVKARVLQRGSVNSVNLGQDWNAASQIGMSYIHYEFRVSLVGHICIT